MIDSLKHSSVPSFYYCTSKQTRQCPILYPRFREAYISDVVLYHHRLACLATEILARPIHFDSDLVASVSTQKPPTSQKRRLLSLDISYDDENMLKASINVPDTRWLNLRWLT